MFDTTNVNWKDFFYYYRRTRYAVLLLLILIVLTLVLNILISRQNSSEFYLNQNDSIISEFAASRESLNTKENIASRVKPENGNITYNTQRKHGDVFVKQNKSIKRQSRIFSENESDTSEWNNSTLRKHNTEIRTQNSYSTNYQQIEKLKAGETIFLNETDTTQWKKIPGIGSSYASRIVKYRDLLGGYVHKEQLMEVYGLDAELYSRIESYIVIDSNYTKLNINNLQFRSLLRHPYLSYKQVQAIMNLREQKGDIMMVEELAMLDEFTSEDIERLEPYLQFK